MFTKDEICTRLAQKRAQGELLDAGYNLACFIASASLIAQKDKTNEDSVIHINCNKNTIELLVVNKGQLQLFNVFEHHSKEDFIYYILFVFEQLKLDVETTLIKLSGSIDKDDELYTILYTYVRHIDFITLDFNFKISNTIEDSNLHHHYLILNSF